MVGKSQLLTKGVLKALWRASVRGLSCSTKPTTLLVADVNNHVIRAVSLSDRFVRTHAGQSEKPGDTDGKAALLKEPYALAFHSPSNTLFVGEWDGFIRRVAPEDGFVSTLWVKPPGFLHSEEDKTPRSRRFSIIVAGCAALGSNLIVSDLHCVRRVPLDGGLPSSLVAGHPDNYPRFDDGIGETAGFFWPRGLATDNEGNIFVADSGNHAIRMIDRAGVVTTVAGNGEEGHKDGPAKCAQFNSTKDIAVDTDGNLLVTDCWNHCIRKVNLQTETVSTLAGQPTMPGHEDGTCEEAMFENPVGLVLDTHTRSMYVSCGNHTIRRVSPDGMVDTFCGTAGERGYKDGAEAKFNRPVGLALH